MLGLFLSPTWPDPDRVQDSEDTRDRGEPAWVAYTSQSSTSSDLQEGNVVAVETDNGVNETET